MVRRLVGLVLALALALVACVGETTVIGDDRSRAACAEAVLIEAVPSGCTTPVVIDSASALGCAFRGSGGELLEDLHGSWVRLHRFPERAAVVRVRDLDITAGGRGASMHLTTSGAAPCSCDIERLQSFGLGEDVFEWPLTYVDQELLFSTPRRFEVQICSLDEDPYPRCESSGGDAGGTCPGLPFVRGGGFCACLPPCTSAAECPIPASGSASVECTPAGTCELRCSDTARCPDGQECVEDRHGRMCMWPG